MTQGYYDNDEKAWLYTSLIGSGEDFKQKKGSITKAYYGKGGPDNRVMGAYIDFNYPNSDCSVLTLSLQDPDEIRKLLNQFRERAVHDLEGHVIDVSVRKFGTAAGFSVVTHTVPVDKVKGEKVA